MFDVTGMMIAIFASTSEITIASIPKRVNLQCGHHRGSFIKK